LKKRCPAGHNANNRSLTFADAQAELKNLSYMRQSIKEFVKIVAETLPVFEPIYEFGSQTLQERNMVSDVRSFNQKLAASGEAVARSV
jgi:hypothetical protein